MKRTLSILLAFVMAAGLVFTPALTAHADTTYGICQDCNGTGKCGRCKDSALGEGYVDCLLCGGTGKVKCGTNTTGDGERIGCDGSGYFEDGSECYICGGKGWYECDQCDKDHRGRVDCKCREEGHPGVCLYCLGSGWRIVNDMGEGINTGSAVYPPDGATVDAGVWGRHEFFTYDASVFGTGVTPMAAAANAGASDIDGFWKVMSDIKYGGQSDPGGEDPSQEPGGETGDGQPQEDRWKVDFGTGTWTVGSNNVVARIDGSTVSGTVEVTEFQGIFLENLDSSAARVLVRGENGFEAALVLSGNGEVSVGRHEPTDCVIPKSVSLVIEAIPEERPIDVPGDEPGSEPGSEPVRDVPGDRNSDYEIPADENAEARARIEVGAMTAEQQLYYAGLSDEDLAEIINDIQNVVGSADPGRMEDGAGELLSKIARKNGIESLKEGRLYPIAFVGNESFSFPVKVTVKLGAGELDGGRDIYVYHVKESGEIELLGKSEYCTYPDGSIESLSFFANEFDLFFTADRELDVSSLDVTSDSAEEPNEFNPTGIIIAAVVGVSAIIAVVICILIRKRHGKGAAGGEAGRNQ